MARYWANRESVVVGVNGQRLVDPSDSGGVVPAVVVVVPSFAAHSLAHVLADWSAIGELMEAGRCGEELLAAMLHHAAEEAGCQEARGCLQPPGVPDGDEIDLFQNTRRLVHHVDKESAESSRERVHRDLELSAKGERSHSAEGGSSRTPQAHN